jgi:glycosyltransferase involved in cell wall biosynthesis
MTPFVSVIVPCRNEAVFVGRCLDSILTSDYPPARMEVIVADGRSTDGTLELLTRRAAGEPRLRVIDNPQAITPVALNRAIAASRGEILVRFDAHAVMPSDYLHKCVALLEASGAANVGGTIRTVPQSSGVFSAPIAEALASRFGVGNSCFRTSAGAKGPRPADTVFGGCWRRELFARVGGFNEQLPRSQDIEFNSRLRRAGETILLDPEIVCDYYARSALSSFWSHNFCNGVWAILPFAFSNATPIRPRHCIPLLFVVSLLISILLPFPWKLAVPATYAAANLASSARTALMKRRIGYLALMPVAFATLHLAYGLGSLCGCLQLAARKGRAFLGEKYASRNAT